MKKLFVKIFLVLSLSQLVINVPQTFAQDFNQVVFSNYNIEDGLSSNSVYSIIQDSLGFIWFGTQNGFCRFDGREFKIFREDPYDSNSLSFNNAGNLFYDSQGKIWIGTWGEGADCFDPETETFRHFKNDPKDSTTIAGERIQTIFEDSFGTLWFCSETHGLSRLDPENREKGIFTNYVYDQADPHSISSMRVRNVVEDKDGNLWFSSNNGFFRLKKENRDKGIFERFYLPKIDKKVPSDVVYNIFVSSDNKLYLGTNYGLFIIERPDKLNREGVLKKEEVIHKFFFRRYYALDYTTIFSIFEDSEKRIWLGTKNGGLILLGFGKAGYKRYVHKPYSGSSLQDNHITSIFEDRTHNLWIGTLEGGVAKINLKKTGFHSIASRSLEISFIADAGENRFYYGTNRALYYFELDKDRVKNRRIIKLYPETLTYLSFPKGFYYKGKMYAYNSLFKFIIYDENSRKTEFPEKLNSKISQYASLMDIEKSGKDSAVFWLVFEDGNILRYNAETGLIHEYIVIAKGHYGKLTTLFEDSNGNLWIGTAEGLGFWKRDETVLEYELPFEIKLFKHQPSNKKTLVNNYITTIEEDDNGNIWVGTLNGVSRMTFKETDAIFTNSTIKNGLTYNKIESLVNGNTRYIWCGTDYGLSAIARRSLISIVFYESDGLPSNNFSTLAKLRTQDGRILMGTSHGLLYFYPDSIVRNTYRPKGRVSDIFVVNAKDKYFHGVPYLNKIVLNHDENSLIIKLASLEFTNPKANKFLYIVKGYHRKWVKNMYNNTLLITDLDPGEYQLKFSVSNNNNRWTRVKNPLTIIIKPAFYQTWIFKISLVFLFIILLFRLHYKKQKSLKKLQKEIDSRIKAEKELKKSEERFREFVEKAVDAIMALDVAGKIIDVNPGFTQLTGLAKEEIINKNFANFIYEEDVENVNAKFKGCVSGKVENFQTRILTRNKDYEWFSAVIKPVFNENGSVKFIHAIARNISELKKTEMELREAKRKAEQAEKIKFDFLAQMSHEIRTPVYTITNATEILKYRGYYEKEDVDFALETLRKASERIFRTIDLILRMAEINSGSYYPKFRKENLTDLVKLMYSRYKECAKDKDLEIHLNVPEKKVFATYDPDALEIVLDNILNNAVKFTDEGKINVSLYENDGKITVEIADTGKGITEEEKEIIFAPFMQSEQGYKRKFDGTGLGLSISVYYCEQNNCKLEIEDNVPRGTKVKLTFG